MALAEDRLCEYAASLGDREFSMDTRQRVGQALLDWFTAGWSGAGLAAATQLRTLAESIFPGSSRAPVFGAPARLTAIGAAFANAGVTHLREIDDAHRTALLHPGIVAISPALALAADDNVSTARLTAAIVAGYEVALRVGQVLGSDHSGKFHSTATAGSLGAAAASAVVLGLDAGQFHHALGIAATQAAGLWQFIDDAAHEAKVLHPAFAVRNGMTAAYAAKAGYPGAKAFITGRRGMYALLHANGPLESLDADLGKLDRIHTTTIKPWPTCGQLFTAVGAVQALLDLHSPAPSDIESVDIAIFPQALRIAAVDWPAKPAETSFSGRYCAAVLLAKGRLGIEDMEAPDFSYPGLQELAARIRVRAEPEYAAAFPDRRPCTVTIKMKDGRVLAAMRDIRRGDPEDPFDWEGLDRRLREFVPGIAESDAAAVAGWCRRLPNQDMSQSFRSPPASLFYKVAE